MPVDDFHARAIKRVRDMWLLYIIDRKPDEIINSFRYIPENMLVIGTGRREFYESRDEYISGLSDEQIGGRDIHFELQDEWYGAQTITDGVCVVYGSIWVREKPTPGKSILVDMEGSRFTVVCRDLKDDVQICSAHHSMPFLEQCEDDYYPKTLTSIANEAVRKSKALERRLELDHMTELYNRVSMERHVSDSLEEQDGYFFVIDLDNFKSVNDTMGHLTGDAVIKGFALLLKDSFSEKAVLGRMGGDEFAVWDSNMQSREEAERRFKALLEGCHRLSDEVGCPVKCSAGIAMSCRNSENFTELYKRCDLALYCAKALGKGCFSWAP